MQRGTGTSTSKVAEVTLAFWIIKIGATTLGETAGDAVSMSLNFGYLAGTVFFAMLFAAGVVAQLRSLTYRPILYWATILATTTVGTTLADFVTRSIGIGYGGGSALLLLLVLLSLLAWYLATGKVSMASISTRKAEIFYWLTVMFSQTLGTALGDCTADSAQLGYVGAALLFSGLLALIGLAYYLTAISRTALFWVAFILTRPLGAVFGDLLDKPVDHGGLALSRFTASAALLAFMSGCILLTSRSRPR